MKPIKVIIAGGRDFIDQVHLNKACDSMLKGKPNIEIVSGGAFGADKMGEIYAKDNGYTFKVFKADWNTHGKSAGFIRNKQMSDYADALIAFWDGNSSGTLNMIETAKKKGMPVKVVGYQRDFIHQEGFDMLY